MHWACALKLICDKGEIYSQNILKEGKQPFSHKTLYTEPNEN